MLYGWATLLSSAFFYMAELSIFEIDSDYINYLSSFEPHLFRNKKITQNFTRKYIGIVLRINGLDYFAPLSSFKPKHKRLSETTDFIKLDNYAVVNLNNMFPAPMNLCAKVIIKNLQNEHYRNLVRTEYRIIKKKQELIIKNAQAVYSHKVNSDGKSKLSKRCNDFTLLEQKCREWNGAAQ